MRQAKLLSLLLNRDDWHMVVDDLLRLGIVYLNEVAHMELADWKDFAKLLSVKDELSLRIITGSLPGVEEHDD